jgi:hypothetical protein
MECFVFIYNFIAVSSPVFLNMFQTQMREEKEGLVEIDDFDKETVERMINWMYIGYEELKYMDFNGQCDLFK